MPYYVYVSIPCLLWKVCQAPVLETQVFIISNSGLSKLLHRRLLFNEMELGNSTVSSFHVIKTFFDHQLLVTSLK